MLIAPTVLGQEVSTSATSTESSTTSSASTDTATTSVTAASGASSGTTVSTATTTNGGPQSTPAAPETTPQPQAQTAVETSATTTASSSSETQASKAASTTSASSTPATSSSNNGNNQGASIEAETPMMDVEQYTVDKKDSSVTQTDDKKLLKIRRDGDEKTRDLYDVKREVKDNGDGTLDVTLKVTPKQIDEGADVMALLDVSQKMTKENFDKAKEQIKKMVTTLTSKSANGQQNLNNRNTVRLMTFYREISDPIDLSGKTSDEVEDELNKIWNRVKKEEWDWGVDLQGAIHKARDIFKNEKNSKKRQHIVLFSQGESTFSYDIKDKSKLSKSRLTEVTTSNPLLHWPPIFNHTNRKADMLEDFNKFISLVKKLGINIPSTIQAGLQTASLGTSIFSSWSGTKSLTEYITLQEYQSGALQEEFFDYTKRVGEGYHHHSFFERNISDMPMKNVLEKLLDQLPKLDEKDWFGWVLGKLSLKDKYENNQKVALMKILDYLFYTREYVYYNHNLSAIAEAKMAQEEGITFYSVDVTSPKQAANKRTKRSADTPKEKLSEKFDKYLKEMSEGGKEFFNDVDKADKFKDTLTELKIKDEFTEKVTVQKDSKGKEYHKTSLISETPMVNHIAAATTKGFFGSTTKESLTWTISKDQLKKAFEDGKPLTLTYKLKVENDKLKKALDDNREKKRKKRDTSTENENSVTEKIISNTITYQINQKKGDGKRLDDVNLTYSKFKVPVPQIDGHVIEPQAPKLPELPPVIERGPVLDYTEESIYRLPLEHGSNAPDTQVTIEEDTVPQRPDILVGGQSDPIDITEDTQPSVSGSNDATVVEEDTVPQRPDILVGGQSDPIDITEDTQPGMSGSNDATVIEEDTKPKRFFHFDNEPQAPEKPKEQPSLSLPQAPVYKAAHHLPASGDKREASFTIAALTIIGAAGLLSKKRRDTEEN